MKPAKRIIHIVKHIKTGANIPIIITKVNDENLIDDFKELTEKRKGFTLNMLKNRWGMNGDDVLNLLKEYQVPGHLNHNSALNISEGRSISDIAFFFEEYIFGIENKTMMTHKKLKSIKYEAVKIH